MLRWNLKNGTFEGVMKKYDLLCVGHCCHDVVDDGFILGGTSSYAAIVAKRLDLHVAILTSFGSDFLFESTFVKEGISFFNVPAEHTTIFDNQYMDDGSRNQHILARANGIGPQDLDPTLLKAKIVLLGPIAKEIDFQILDMFPKSIKAATLQGLIRKWDDDGFVEVENMNWELLSGLDIVFISNDDIKGHEHFLDKITEQVNHVIMTKGGDGASIFMDGKELTFPSYPVQPVDTTGAGDVFTVAYLAEYCRTGDLQTACSLAHCAASFIIQGVGISNLPSESDIKNRLEVYSQLL